MIAMGTQTEAEIVNNWIMNMIYLHYSNKSKFNKMVKKYYTGNNMHKKK